MLAGLLPLPDQSPGTGTTAEVGSAGRPETDRESELVEWMIATEKAWPDTPSLGWDNLDLVPGTNLHDRATGGPR